MQVKSDRTWFRFCQTSQRMSQSFLICHLFTTDRLKMVSFPTRGEVIELHNPLYENYGKRSDPSDGPLAAGTQMTQCNIEKKENKHFRRFNLFVGVSYHVTYITKQPISYAQSPALGVSMCPRYSPPGNTEPTHFCYHCAIYFNLTLNKPSNIRKTIVSRALKSIHAGNFVNAGKICKSSLKYISQRTEKVVPAQSNECLVFKNDLHVPLLFLYASPATVLRQQMICSLGYQRDRFVIIPSSYISNLRDYR